MTDSIPTLNDAQLRVKALTTLKQELEGSHYTALSGINQPKLH